MADMLTYRKSAGAINNINDSWHSLLGYLKVIVNVISYTCALPAMAM